MSNLKITFTLTFLLVSIMNVNAQMKVGINPKNLDSNVYFEVEAVNGNRVIVTKDSAKVGIGTLTPNAKLDVIGSIKITDGTQSAGKVLVSDANGLASWKNVSTLVTVSTDSTTASNGLTLSGKDVQLGGTLTKATSITTSASNTLSLSGIQGGTTSDSALMVDPTTGVIKRIAPTSISQSSEPWFNVATNKGATSNTQNIYQMGNIGINTNNPLTSLHIAGTSPALSHGLLLEENGATYPRRWALASRSDFPAFAISDETSTLTRLTIFNSTGNIGLSTGVFAPQSRLEVKGNNGVTVTTDVSGLRTMITFRSSIATDSVSDWVMYKGDGTAGYKNGLHLFSYPKNSTSYGSCCNTRMSWLDNGNIGIGTVSPSNKLEIAHGASGNSGLRFTNLNNSNTAVSSSSVNQKYLSVNSSGDVVLANSVDQVINVTGLASGLVSPISAATFQAGTFENSYSKTDSTVLYVNQTDGTQWVYTATAGGQYKSYVAPASTEWYLANSTNDAGSSKTTSIYRKGFVGINTTNPLTSLHLAGTSAALSHGILLEENGTVNPRKWSICSRSDIPAFAIADETSGNFRFVILNSNGNVGIGTGGPTWNLDVRKNSSTSEQIAQFVNTSTTTSAEAKLGIGAGPGAWGSIVGYNGTIGFRNYTTNSEYLTLKNHNGFIGIGTTSPSYPLHVKSANGISLYVETTVGDPNGALAVNVPTLNTACGAGQLACSEMIMFQVGGTNIGSISPNNAGTGTQYNTTSDYRLKENIKPTFITLSELMKIKVVDYNYKTDKNKNVETGFIAQDLFKIIPQVVKQGSDEINENGMPIKPWMVDYSKLTPILVKATQELKFESDSKNIIIQEQKERIDKLESELKLMKELMKKLEQFIKK